MIHRQVGHRAIGLRATSNSDMAACRLYGQMMGDFFDEHIEDIIGGLPSPDEILNQELYDETKRAKMFSIRKIVVHDTCDRRILKILKPGEYVFTNPDYDTFFIDGVTVCSVVGKNGCGKSSLIELLFRMINNLGAMMLKELERPAAETLYFIDGVVADLHYSIDNTDGTLSCRRDAVALEHGAYSFVWNITEPTCIYKKDGVEQHEYDFTIARNVAEHFFYLVATNYSMQAYIDTDYSHETVYSWRDRKDAHGEILQAKEWHVDETGIWINSVFHKNDGYMCPIVLNPYRNEGEVDMAKEAHLTTNRLCALLLQTKNDYQVIDGYRLAFVNYKFNQRYLLDKFDRQMLRDIPVERVSDKFMYAYIQRNSYAQAILDVYGIDAEKSMNYIELTLRLYLVYKTFSIAEKYPQYGHFKPLGNVNNAFKNNPNQHELRMVRELAEMISQRETHIELKIHQTINLIRRLDTFKNKRVFERPITYDEMCTLLGVDTNCDSILQRMQTLPPPLFEPSIYLIKNDVYNSIIETTSDERVRKRLIERNVISLSELSSGERQFIYTTSTLLYHALNIQSISPIDRVAYRNLCLVLEEVEICFHPEYQRTFINSLLSLLARTGLNKAFGICVVVVTHSPFVLSDMPKGNILYLDEGRNVTAEKHLNTFGANVNELLCQSFFLSSGFMGEFAMRKIESLVKYLHSDDPDEFWNENKAKNVIELVGDEVIKYQLRQLYAAKFKDSEDYKNWIAREARRLGV